MRIAFPRRAGRPASVRTAAFVLVTIGFMAATCEDPALAPLSETERVVHLLSRATYGVRPGDVDAVLEMGTEAWLERQLHPGRVDDSAVAARIERMAERPQDTRSVAVMMVQPKPSDTTGRPQAAVQRMVAEQRRVLVRAFVLGADAGMSRMVATKVQRAVHSERQLEEVMTDFWFNHFNVNYAGQARYVLEDYEREAIRSHVFGRFEDMLAATAQHAAMMIYLDNYKSTAPAEDGTGLNENYARELLELHTLGVDGGYTQEDVIEVARAFTGWTIEVDPADGVPAAVVRSSRSRKTRFVFRPEHHDRGEKVVLGRTLPAGRGVEDGLDVLDMLAAHPSTAEHIATKLVQHFVADEPPPELVAEVAGVFRETGGDLREVTRALFTADAFYDRANYRAKAKRPFEFLASALRATGTEVNQPLVLHQKLSEFGHLPYAQPDPTGYPTEATEWFSAGAIMGRIDFAMDLAAGNVPGVAFDPDALVLGAAPASTQSRGDGPGEASAFDDLTARVLDRLFAGQASDSLRVAIAQDLAGLRGAEPGALLSRAIGLALGSPEFQRH